MYCRKVTLEPKGHPGIVQERPVKVSLQELETNARGIIARFVLGDLRGC